jgi:hypothetical protein
VQLSRRCATALSAVLLAVLVLAGCSSTPPTLVPGLRPRPPDPAKGVSGVSLPMRADTFSIEMGTFLCSVRDVRLTSVRLYRARGGIRLARWGIENQRITDNANANGPLTRLGPFTSHAITRRCGHDQWYSRVGLELHRTRPGPASWLGLRVTYDSDGHAKVAYLWEQYHVADPQTRSPRR